MSVVDELLVGKGGEGTLLSTETPGEIVTERQSHERCLEVTEVEAGSRGDSRKRLGPGRQLEVAGGSSGAMAKRHAGTRPHPA
jgi:hypothetical protein